MEKSSNVLDQYQNLGTNETQPEASKSSLEQEENLPFESGLGNGYDTVHCMNRINSVKTLFNSSFFKTDQSQEFVQRQTNKISLPRPTVTVIPEESFESAGDSTELVTRQTVHTR